MKFLLIFSALICFSCFSDYQDHISTLSNYNFENPLQVKITSKLDEISGLTLTSNGNLAAINDETGIIYHLNPFTGDVIKRYFLGRWTAEDDFEGIAAAADAFYVISSNGKLYKFDEGENEKAVDYEIINLNFSSKFDMEGLYYDKELNGLLIIPKEYSGKNYKDKRAIYFYSLKENKINPVPIITISLKKLKKDYNIKDFYPSGITRHLKSGNLMIISAKGDNVIVEVDDSGNVVGIQKLKEKTHRQPEGITILDDYTLIICDEAAGKKPTLTRYMYNK